MFGELCDVRDFNIWDSRRLIKVGIPLRYGTLGDVWWKNK